MFLIIGVVNAYALLKLHQLSIGTAQIINVDERILDLKRKLADSILSQMGYEKKYIITKDANFHGHFLSSRNDFNKYLTDAFLITDTLPKKESLDRVKAYYDQYVALILAEADEITNHKPYPKNLYQQEKGKLVERILEDLKVLEVDNADVYYCAFSCHLYLVLYHPKHNEAAHGSG